MPELQYRHFRAEAAGFKKSGGKRTLKVAFSSETPVLRYENGKKYREVLSHDPGDGDISLLQDGGAFIDEHDWEHQIGSVERAWIDGDRKGRAVLSFADTKLAGERWDLMSSGHRKDISFGYVQTKMLGETMGADGIPVRRFAWKAYEITSTAVGADHFATGVGRSHQIQFNNNNKQFMTQETIKSEMVALERDFLHDHPHIENEIKQIHARALCEDMSLRDYKSAMMDLIRKNPAKRTILAVDHEIGMDRGEIQQFSLVRALRNAVENGGKLKGCFEADCSEQVEKTCGTRAEGFYVPSDVILGGKRSDFLKRDLFTGDFGSGGAAVVPQMPLPPIELLRNRVVCARLGATYVGGLQGPCVIARQTAPLAVQALAEIAQLQDSQLVLDQIILMPHRIGATTTISKQLILQSTPDIQAVVQNDIIESIAVKHDEMILNGSGANDEPLGLLNTPGLNTVAFGGAPTWASIVSFETFVGKANADGAGMAYVTTPGAKGILKTTAVALQGATTVSSRAIWDNGTFNDGSNDGIMNSYRSASTNQVPLDRVVFGRWSQLMVGVWGGLDMVLDVYTKAKSGELVITANTWLDAALRHPQAFTVSSDSGAQ